MNPRPGRQHAPGWLAGLFAAVLTLAACTTAQSPTATTTAPVPPGSALVSATPNTGSSASSPASSSAGPAATSQSPAAPEPATIEPDPTAAGSANSAATEPAEPPSPPAGFQSTISEIDAATRARMGSSWRPGCPVPLSDLRYLTVSYRGFDGANHSGELVVAQSVADDVVDIFRQLYDADYPIAALRLVDDFGASDDDSMAADNSSAFNCRPVTGGGGFSEHSYGTAIDLNPIENPYLNGNLVLPPAGRPFADRHPAPGVIQPGDTVVQAFASHGWTWGGSWSGPIDYQHFSLSGR